MLFLEIFVAVKNDSSLYGCRNLFQKTIPQIASQGSQEEGTMAKPESSTLCYAAPSFQHEKVFRH
jgi:hypothetical protein